MKNNPCSRPLPIPNHDETGTIDKRRGFENNPCRSVVFTVLSISSSPPIYSSSAVADDAYASSHLFCRCFAQPGTWEYYKTAFISNDGRVIDYYSGAVQSFRRAGGMACSWQCVTMIKRHSAIFITGPSPTSW